MNRKEIYLAGGCFWGVNDIFKYSEKASRNRGRLRERDDRQSVICRGM